MKINLTLNLKFSFCKRCFTMTPHRVDGTCTICNK